MITISKAPVRLGLAGGGTDIESYFQEHTGVTLNATINSHVRCYIEDSTCLNFISIDRAVDLSSADQKYIMLHKHIYDYFCEKYLASRPTLKISTYTDVEAGSGLGTSSTMVISILAALGHHFRKHLCPRSLVKDAHHIEREICNLNGGWQDYISAAYGGFNFTRYDRNGEHWVKPMKLSSKFVETVEESLVLFFSGVSRDSDRIISDQINSVSNSDKVKHLHLIRESAQRMVDAFENESLKDIVSEVNSAWLAKKQSSESITNNNLDELENKLRSLGAMAFKVSGAGGGGYCMVFLPPKNRSVFLQSIRKTHTIRPFSFYQSGVQAWTENQTI